ncbi:MAG: hypothetical protein MUP98_11550 [Candidatus Aminicenantes bacterium]|nr:hypothetical protein [Candidatus Aminicenantes bacterium]
MSSEILSLLGIKPSAESIDYVNNKKPFQLHTLLTEQRHPKTMNLSSVIKDNVAEGLRQILAVDEDISSKFKLMSQNTTLLTQAAHAVSQAIKEKKKIYIYGCGATGRLSKQMESALWRPFWTKVKGQKIWEKLKLSLPEDIENRLFGEMTGGDRALISSLEGFEDLELMGKLQLKDRGINRDDAVFCITEGGETSSVIGTILAAVDLYGSPTQETYKDASHHLYFIYNNPDELLVPFERSRKVIEHPAITKINLATGPQAITGSTRMQATTSETFVMGLILEAGIFNILKDLLSQKELEQIGFSQAPQIEKKLQDFDKIQKLLLSSVEDISRFTALESKTYKNNRLVTYFAKRALITVFIDCAERSPTFHLFPLDTILEEKRKCWLQVWTEAENGQNAWTNFLGRNFRGLDKQFYRGSFEKEIHDPYLKKAALNSLAKAGRDQEKLYDFSFSKDNLTRRGPQEGDLGVLVCVDEEIEELADPKSHFRQFISLFKDNNARIALVYVGEKSPEDLKFFLRQISLEKNKDLVLCFIIDSDDDTLNIKQEILLKILLNAHSTGVMARLGKVVGNTMTNVKPSNLKLIGRATHLIFSHVNDHVPITYEEANAVLFDAIDFLGEKGGQTSEVELSIIRILETNKQKKAVSWDQSILIAESDGLEQYLKAYNPAIHR